MARLKLLPILETSDAPRLGRAAQYLRMSTDMQQCSIQMQSDCITEFAEREGLVITHTYADPGRSGLTLRGRPALQALLEDVERGADFEFLLVYDVSRWGRFQDVDESAFYEFRCRRAGVKVIYCAEPFENDGSAIGAVFKSIKRAMAGEFSRELSTKIARAQLKLSEKGYWQGGPPGFALERQVLGTNGQAKGVLRYGEYKFLRQDHVRLVAGDPTEVATVRRIFQLYTIDGLDRVAIARRLNAEGVPRRTRQDGSKRCTSEVWYPGAVRFILRNESYVGHYVYNRHTQKLGTPVRPTSSDKWVRVNGAFEAIIEQSVFDLAQRIMLAHGGGMTDEQMLDRLRVLLAQHGKLTAKIVDADRETPSTPIYAKRFGGLLKAYDLIGWRPERDWRPLALVNVRTGERRKAWNAAAKAAREAGEPVPPFETHSARDLERAAKRAAKAARRAAARL